APTFRYGQRHEIEIAAARRVARALHVTRHEIVEFDLRRFGGSALTDAIAVPKDRTPAELACGIPVTYVPARNTIFLSFALAWAEVVGAADIFIGVTALDYSGYPDCRPEYIAAFQTMADLATRAGVEGRQRVRIHTPLIALSKREIILTGLSLGLDYALTSTCYDPAPGGDACGRCDTDFVGTDGPGGGRFDSSDALARAVVAAWPARGAAPGGGRRFVVCTGGEPLLQLDEPLTAALHATGFEIAIETNGTLLPPRGIDWVCVSPKAGVELVLRSGDELKLVYPQEGISP